MLVAQWLLIDWTGNSQQLVSLTFRTKTKMSAITQNVSVYVIPKLRERYWLLLLLRHLIDNLCWFTVLYPTLKRAYFVHNFQPLLTGKHLDIECFASLPEEGHLVAYLLHWPVGSAEVNHAGGGSCTSWHHRPCRSDQEGFTSDFLYKLKQKLDLFFFID